MAISNFTNSPSVPGSFAFLLGSFLLGQHEKKSCSLAPDFLDAARFSAQAISMLSQSYIFELLNPAHESWRSLGRCTIVSVVIDEGDIPALGLKLPDGDVHYFSIAELKIN